MSLTVKASTGPAGDRTFILQPDDISKHPDSLLHTLYTSVADGDKPATLDLKSLPDSPFTSWPEAAAVTEALYRHGHIPIGILDSLAHSYPAYTAYCKLQQLLDFLKLGCHLDEWLPKSADVPLKQLAALDLQYYIMAASAVDKMINSSAISSADPAIRKERAVAFGVVERPGTSLVVYQVPTNYLPRIGEQIRKGVSSEMVINGGYSNAEITLRQLPQGASVPLLAALEDLLENGVGRAHSLFGGLIAAALSEAVKRVRPTGLGKQDVCWGHMEGRYEMLPDWNDPYIVPLWVVYW